LRKRTHDIEGSDIQRDFSWQHILFSDFAALHDFAVLRRENAMVGLKGKSGRHKNSCCCIRCNERKAIKKEEATIIAEEKAIEQKPVEQIQA
jgi:hypothetical protein